MFSNLPTTNFNFLVTLILSSANTLNWYKSEILSFGSELKDISVWIQFSTSPVQKPKCITGAVYSTAHFPLSIFFYCASDSAHFSFSTEIPSRIRPFMYLLQQYKRTIQFLPTFFVLTRVIETKKNKNPPCFNSTETFAFKKHCRKRRNC